MKVGEISVKTQQWFIHGLPLSSILISTTLASDLMCGVCFACSLGCSFLNFLLILPMLIGRTPHTIGSTDSTILIGVTDAVANTIIGPDIMKLPAVLYYKKGNKKHGITKKGDKKHSVTSKKHRKHKIEHASKVIDKRDNDDGGRRDVVFLSRPSDYSPTKLPSSNPTTSYSLFDYKSNYRNWLFLYPEEHPVHMQYVDQGKAADPNQQNGAQQQAAATQDATAAAAAPATGTAAPAAAPAVPGAAAAVAPAAPAVGQTATPTEAAPAVAAAPSVAAATNPVAPQVGEAATPVAAQQPAAPVAAQQPAVPVAAQLPAAPVVAQQPAAPVAAQQPAAPVAAQQPAAPVAAQQPAASVATQQPGAAQAETAANETIQLINQTVSSAVNATFEPNVANASQANETVMVGALPVGNNTTNQTVAPGNIAHRYCEKITSSLSYEKHI